MTIIFFSCIKSSFNRYWMYSMVITHALLLLSITFGLGVSELYENIALLGVATQIDDWSADYVAGNANDGNTDGDWNSGSGAHTRSKGTHVWWKLTLPNPMYISRIVIHNQLIDLLTYRGELVFVDGDMVGAVTGKVPVTSLENINRFGKEVKLMAAKSHLYLDLAEVEVFGMNEDVKCYDSSGKMYRGRENFDQEDGKTCTCGVNGLICRCEGEDISCKSGTYKWTDQVSCVAECIKNDGYCSSTGDPHYRSFDGRYFDFHGDCTYQAASCGDFKVNFKNKDFYNRAPRFTLRAELVFKGVTYSIANKFQAMVNGQSVQLPYIKPYTNGDRVEIVSNGQLEINLYRPIKVVRIRATDASSYIQAELWLHGSCSGITEGICGNWNGNPDDDLTGGSANSLGTLHQLYDENCLAPPAPPHPCDDVSNGHVDAAAICDTLKGEPFTSCHSNVSYGDKDGGVYHNCMTDVCNCLMDTNCACSQYDSYASSCIEAKIDLSNWRSYVDYCPFDCPEGLTYKSAGSLPAPSCLKKDPKEESTVRGCFCPEETLLQDGKCVSKSECRCLFEGEFYEVGAVIKMEGKCEECTCAAAGELSSCTSLSCDIPVCQNSQILASRDDLCCPYCDSDWVEALNPQEKTKEGQDVVLTCQVNTGGLSKEDIVWSKDGNEIENGVSKDGLLLKITNAGEDDDGSYTCTATKGEASSKAEFGLTVDIPKPTIVFTPKKTKVSCKKNKKKCKASFKISKEDGGPVDKKDVTFCKLVEGELKSCNKVTYKKKRNIYIGKIKKPSTSDSGDYVCVVTEDGKQILSDPVVLVVN